MDPSFYIEQMDIENSSDIQIINSKFINTKVRIKNSRKITADGNSFTSFTPLPAILNRAINLSDLDFETKIEAKKILSESIQKLKHEQSESNKLKFLKDISKYLGNKAVDLGIAIIASIVTKSN